MESIAVECPQNVYAPVLEHRGVYGARSTVIEADVGRKEITPRVS